MQDAMATGNVAQITAYTLDKALLLNACSPLVSDNSKVGMPSSTKYPIQAHNEHAELNTCSNWIS